MPGPLVISPSTFTLHKVERNPPLVVPLSPLFPSAAPPSSRRPSSRTPRRPHIRQDIPAPDYHPYGTPRRSGARATFAHRSFHRRAVHRRPDRPSHVADRRRSSRSAHDHLGGDQVTFIVPPYVCKYRQRVCDSATGGTNPAPSFLAKYPKPLPAPNGTPRPVLFSVGNRKRPTGRKVRGHGPSFWEPGRGFNSHAR